MPVPVLELKSGDVHPPRRKRSPLNPDRVQSKRGPLPSWWRPRRRAA
jgi:hypothetical protein